MEKKKKIIIWLAIILVVLVVAVWFMSRSYQSFGVDSVFFKSVLRQGESSEKSFKINSFEKQDFNLSVYGLENFVFLDKSYLSLNKGESGQVKIRFNGNDTGIYVGYLEVKSDTAKNIPIILEVQSQEQNFALNTGVGYDSKEVDRGDKTITDISLFNLKDTEEHLVELTYAIKDINGGSIVEKSENISVASKYSFVKIIELPKDIRYGSYVYAVTLKDGESISTSSYLLNVAEKTLIFKLNFTMLMIIFVVFVLLIIVYILYERSKIMRELESHHKSDLEFYGKSIDRQKNVAVSKLEGKEKTKVLKEFEDARKKIIREIKGEQENQIKELNKIKSKCKEKDIEKKIKIWHKRGYSRAIKTAKIDKNIKLKLEILEKARLGGFISKEAYSKGRQRLRKSMRH